MTTIKFCLLKGLLRRWLFQGVGRKGLGRGREETSGAFPERTWIQEKSSSVRGDGIGQIRPSEAQKQGISMACASAVGRSG